MAAAYHRDQPGAPALVYSATWNGVAQFTALKTVLKACLITGFGAQPAAGWELINEGVNFIVFRSGTHSGYVGLTWVSGGVVRVYLSETYTGMSGDVMSGDGLKTGNAAGATQPQALPAGYLAHSSGTTSWSVVADSRTFTVCMLGHASTRPLTNVSYEGFTLHAGEDTAGNFIAIGGHSTSATSSTSVPAYFSSKNGMTALKYPGTGLLVGSGAIGVVAPSLMRNEATGQFSEIISIASAQLSRIIWAGDSVLAGALRGVAGVPDLANASTISNAARCLGRSGAMNYRDANDAIPLGDGYTYFVGTTNLASFILLTDNQAFW